MAVKKFDPTGDFAAHIVRYLLQKAKEALGSGVSASEGDFTWQTFGKVNGPLAQSISDVHPGGQHDHQRLARVNYNRQASKFVRWLADGRGELTRPQETSVVYSSLIPCLFSLLRLGHVSSRISENICTQSRTD